MRFGLAARLLVVLVAVASSACASGSMPTFDPVAPATVAVNETLRLALSIQNPENLSLSFSFRTDEGDDLGSTASITGTASGAQFRWSPIASQVGEHQVTFVLTSSAGTSEQSTVIRVVPSRDQAPVFLLPGAGGSFDLETTSCVDFDIEVRDEDSTAVDIRARGALPDLSAQITQTGAKSAEFHWCPTPEQVSAQERWTIRLEADDGDHAPTPHDYIAVLRGTPKPSCPGEAPTVAITSPADGARVSASGAISISISAQDELGLRDAPLLYYTTTAPADLSDPDLAAFDDQIEAEAVGANWLARIPAMDLAIGEEVTIYIVATATDNDDTAGTDCDHRSDTPVLTFVAVGATASPDAGTCEPCSSSSECVSGFCATVAGGGTCLDTCASSGASCARGSCLFVTTVEGSLSFACGDADAACTVAPTCTDDSREENDDIAHATTLSAPITNGVICSDDDDFFKVIAAARSRVTVTVDGFEHSDGDIDLQLLSSTGAALATSETTTNVETANVCAGMAGFVYARVLGYDGDANSYHVSATIEPNACCADDEFEEDDGRTSARVLSGTTFMGTICPTDDDYISFTTTSSRRVTATLNFDGAVGDLDLELYDSSGAVVGSSDSTGDIEQIVETVAAGTYSLRVFGFMDAANDYTGSVVLSAP
ncbi:MAG: PPC domain-containing protein [Sandaracinaceae bacterium]|nr:PPC domain-containing protein [Sandaracinaceae bacterium]